MINFSSKTLRGKQSKLKKAAAKMRAALDLLEAVRDDKSDHYFLCEDARYYASELENLLSSDKGEAGIEALIRRIDSRFSPPKETK